MEGGTYSLVPPSPSSEGTRAQESMCSRGGGKSSLTLSFSFCNTKELNLDGIYPEKKSRKGRVLQFRIYYALANNSE